MSKTRSLMDFLPSDEDKRRLLSEARVVWIDKNDLLWVIVDGEQICLGSAPGILGPRPRYILDERNKV